MKAGVFYHPDFYEKGYFILKDRVKPGFDALQDLIRSNKLQHLIPEINSDSESLLALTHSPEHIASVQSEGEHFIALLSSAGVVQAAVKLAHTELEVFLG